MIGAVEGNNSVNSIRYFQATNAFNKASQTKAEISQPEMESGINIRENSILRNINVAEIKEFANSVGETGLTEEDIKYGLKYGRSVLVDYSA